MPSRSRSHPARNRSTSRALEGEGRAGRSVQSRRSSSTGYFAQRTVPEVDDRDALNHAVEVLTAALEEMLHEVGARVIPPEAYHVM